MTIVLIVNVTIVLIVNVTIVLIVNVTIVLIVNVLLIYVHLQNDIGILCPVWIGPAGCVGRGGAHED